MQDMSQFAKLLSRVMGVGANEHLFSSVLWLKTWYEVFVGQVEGIVKEKDVVEGKERRGRENCFRKGRQSFTPRASSSGISH